MIPTMTLMTMMMVFDFLSSSFFFGVEGGDVDGDSGGDFDGDFGGGDDGVGGGLHDDLSGPPHSPSFPSNALGSNFDRVSGIGPCNLLFEKSREFNTPGFNFGIGPVNWLLSK